MIQRRKTTCADNMGRTFKQLSYKRVIMTRNSINQLLNEKIYIFPPNHHHHISVMDLDHLLTRSGLTYPEDSSKFCHDSFCQLENSVSLPWVIYYEAFYLHVVSSFSCIPVICPELVLFLITL
jgi:hypothetical protein